MIPCFVGWAILLSERENCFSVFTSQMVGYDLAVFKGVFASPIAPIIVFQQLFGFQGKDRSLVLIRLAFPDARENDRTSDFPIGGSIRTEQILFNLCGLANSLPNF